MPYDWPTQPLRYRVTWTPFWLGLLVGFILGIAFHSWAA